MLWLPWGGVQWVRREVGHRGQSCVGGCLFLQLGGGGSGGLCGRVEDVPSRKWCAK
jgi:hypothetical protein